MPSLKIFSLEREKVGGEKGGEWRLWECGKPVRVFHHFHGRNEGEKGEVTFSLRPTKGRPLFGSPFSPFPPQRFFFLLLFLLEVVLRD
jgi:hypothetical protein